MKTLNRKGLILIISILTLFLISSAAQAMVQEDQNIRASGDQDIRQEGMPGGPIVKAVDSIEQEQPKYVPGEVLTRFKDGADPKEILKEMSIEIKDIERIHSIKPAVKNFKKDYKLEKDSDGWYWYLGKQYKEKQEVPDEELFKEAYKKLPPGMQGLYRNYKITLSEGASVEETVAKLKSNPNVEYAYPNYIRKASSMPNDPRYPEQWALPKISAPQGWDITEGDPSVAIAVIDTGVDYNHEDLSANIWHPVGEIPNNGIDDDNNGYIDDYNGYDFVSVSSNYVAPGEDPGPADNNPMDVQGHGTHVSGIIAAVKNNNKGICGVAPKCKVMAVRAGFKGTNGGGYLADSDIERAIFYATQNHAKVINMSFGGGSAGTYEDEIKEAYSEGIVLVAAAGNSNTSIESYPAAMEEVIAVAATDQNDSRSIWSGGFGSNYGNWVDVAAPGTSILSTLPGNSYATKSGTSMAAPHVAGDVALILSKKQNLNLGDLKRILRQGIDELTEVDESDSYIGTGRINPNKALGIDSTSEIIYPAHNELVTSDIDITGTVDAEAYILEYGQGNYPVNWVRCGSGAGINNGILGTIRIGELPDGNIFTIRLVINIQGTSIIDRVTMFAEKNFQPGWPQKTVGPTSSSPVCADINNDGFKEVITISSWSADCGGYLYVWDYTGKLMEGWPKFISTYGSYASPAVANLNDDSFLEIAVPRYIEWWDNNIQHFERDVVVYNYKGDILEGWPQAIKYNPSSWASPLLTDLNNDGSLEIIIGTFLDAQNKIYAWKTDGTEFDPWPADISSRPSYTCSAADINKDNKIEVVASGEFAELGGGYVFVFDNQGSALDGFPVKINNSGFLSHPVLADVNNDGELEIIVRGNEKLYVISSKGVILPSWPKAIYPKSVAVGDLNRDGILDIVVGVDNQDPAGGINIYNVTDTGTTEWSINVPYSEFFFPVIIADINEDGFPDIIAADSHLGKVFAFDYEGNKLNGFPKDMIETSASRTSGIAVDDIDSDGTIELVVGSQDGHIYIWDLNSHYDPSTMDWPMFQHDPQHTGSMPFVPPVITSPLPGYRNTPITQIKGTAKPHLTVNIYNNGNLLGSPIADEDGNFALVVNLSADGTYSLRAQAQDAAGNTASSSVVEVTVDTIAPIIEITSPADGYVTNQAPITLTGTVDGMPFSEFRQLPVEGENIITKTADDAAGNTSEKSISVIRDTVPPAGTININNSIFYTDSYTVPVTLSATDNIGIIGYYLSENSSVPSRDMTGWTTIILTANYSATIDYTFSGAGKHTLYVWFKDTVSSISEAASDSIILQDITLAHRTLLKERVFPALFGRLPTEDELNYWMSKLDSGASWASIVKWIAIKAGVATNDPQVLDLIDDMGNIEAKRTGLSGLVIKKFLLT